MGKHGKKRTTGQTPKGSGAVELEKLAWERQDKEGVKPFQAFAMYRDMGNDRSLRDIAKQLNKSLTLIARWSSEWHWVERCKEYDAEIDRKAQKARIKAVEEMNKRHADMAVVFQGKILQRLQSVQLNELSPADMIKWMTEATKLERLARGEPTEHTKQTGGEPEGGKKERVFDIAEKIISDPKAADLACQLFERFTVGESDASGTGDICEQ